PGAYLTSGDIRALTAGQPLAAGGSLRWLGSVVSAPDGTQRLVVTGTGLVGLDTTVRTAGHWLQWAASIGAVLAAIATWIVVRTALRPVGRMRRSVRALPPGQRLPLPKA